MSNDVEPVRRRAVDPTTLRGLQKPLKDGYKSDPDSARITSRAEAVVATDELSVSVPGWAGDVRAGLHEAAGGDGTDACAGDILLQALVACAGVTLRSVATAMGVPLRAATVRAEGHWDARGTLGVSRAAPVGFTDVELVFDIDTDAEAAQVDKLIELAERYCVVAQTLQHPPNLTVRRA